MRRTWQLANLCAIVAACLAPACGPQRVRTPDRPAQSADRPGQALIVLLPDPDTDAVGRATVSNASGTVNLETARDSIVMFATEPPAPVALLSESEIHRIFREALDALPPPPQHFTLRFRFESDDLTEKSRAQVPEILDAIKTRPAPDLVIIGHTDTTGTRAANFDLGKMRAVMVRGLLVDAGVDPASIDIASHGESDPEVQTADDTLEPRNRRVEISVR
jgi:outer membrane protein OmpA-like peptidoglycan-associated protein